MGVPVLLVFHVFGVFFCQVSSCPCDDELGLMNTMLRFRQRLWEVIAGEPPKVKKGGLL